MNNESTSRRLPKSDRLWPVALITAFGIFITGLVSFIVFASMHPVHLVSENYYEEELAYQEQIERQHRTAALGRRVGIEYDMMGKRLRVRVPAEHAMSGLDGRIVLYRPSDARLDFSVPLKPGLEGIQILNTGAMEPGLWRVKLEWSSSQREYFFESIITVDS